MISKVNSPNNTRNTAMLKTESRNEKTVNIDKMTTDEMLSVMQDENEKAAFAVRRAIPEIRKTVDSVYLKMKNGGRLFYVGCGTSGRLGVLDASEIPPTYGVPQGVVIGIIAGGDSALRFSSEGAEDDALKGRSDLLSYNITENDSVIGISAAGGAQYVVGALKLAKEKGAVTACITSNENTKISEYSDYCIVVDTGAEVVTGSTRMKAGTAQKLVLNMISTSLMIKAGYVYENLMINLKPTNVKLRKRMINIVRSILDCGEKEAEDRLEKSGWVIKDAVK